MLCSHEAGHAVVAIHQEYNVTAIVKDGHGILVGGTRNPLAGVAGAVGQKMGLLDTEGVKGFMERWKLYGDTLAMGFSWTDVPPYQDWDRRESLIVKAYEIICQHRALHREISDALFADGIWSNDDEAGRQLAIRCFEIDHPQK